MNNTEILKNLEKNLSAILLLLIEARESKLGNLDNEKAKKIETLLFEAGFKAPEIANLINKNVTAVQKTLQRNRE